MALTADQVLVRMTADTSQYQKSMFEATKAASQFDLKSSTAMSNLGQSFTTLGNTSIKMTQQVHQALNNMSKQRGTVQLERQIDAVIAQMRALDREAAKTELALKNTFTPSSEPGLAPKIQESTKEVRQFNQSVGVMGAQLQDIAVTAAGGMNPLLIALQQGTQISAALAGQGGGGLAAVMGAIKSVLSPASLLTIVLVAGGAALLQWGISAAQAAFGTADFEKELEGLQEVTDNYVSAVEQANIGLEELKNNYGELADEIQLASKQMVLFTGLQAKSAVIASARGLSRQMGLVSPVANQVPVEWSGTVNQDRARVMAQKTKDQMEELRRVTGATADQADRLRMALNRTNSSNSLDAVVKDSQNLLDIIGELSNNPGADQGMLGEWANKIGAVMNIALEQIRAAKQEENDLVSEYAANTQRLRDLSDDRAAAEKLLADATRSNNQERMTMFQEVIKSIDREIDKTKQLARESDIAYQRMARAYREYADSRKEGAEWANSASGFEAQYVAERASGAGSQMEELVRATVALAEQMGVSAKDLLAVMSFETGGTLSPSQLGPTTGQGQHFGLIQFGDKGSGPRYGVTPDSSITEQVIAAGKYLQDAGVKAGDNLASIYAAVLAGDARKIFASDLAAGGVVGNVSEAVGGSQFAPHLNRAEGLLAAYGGPAEEERDKVREKERDAQQRLKEEIRDRERLAEQVKKYGEEIQQNLVSEQKRNELEKARSQRVAEIKSLGLTPEKEKEAITAVNAEMEKQLTIYALLAEAKMRQVDLDALMTNGTMTYRQAIEALGEAKRQNIIATQENARAEEIAGQKADFARSMQEQFKDGLLDAIVAGESFRKVLADLAIQFARVSLQAALFNEGPYSSSSAGKGLIGGLVDFAFGGFRAGGGGVDVGKSYVVGEKGPEVFTPGVSGHISPNSAMGNSLSVQYSPVMHVGAGVTPEQLAMAMNAQSKQMRENFLPMLKKNFPEYQERYT